MRKPFDALWEAMEARRWQLEAGEVPPAYRLDHLRQEGRRDRGCPDVEALCGWVDGELLRNSLRRWLAVWRHMRLRGCRACQGEIVMIGAVAHRAGEVRPPHQRWSPWPAHALKRTPSSLFPSQAPMAWVSGALVVAVGLSLWLLSQHAARNMDGYRVKFPSTKGESERPQPSSERATDGQAARTIIWGD